MMRISPSLLAQLLLSQLLLGRLAAEEPLHQRIDRLTDQHALGPQAEVADDLTFLRRVHLDLWGRVPTSAEARAFLADESPDKRARLVDRLLASPEFSRHMAQVLDVMLMERRGGKYVKTDDWRAWLRKAVEQDKPYIELARDILAAEGAAGENGPAAAFYLERDAEPNLLTREIGRMFFGMDLQCAQCHDHPIIDDYYQEDYYGLFAFVSRLSVFQPDKKKPAMLAETAGGGAKFKSVFTDREAVTAPRLPGSAEFVEPVFAPGDEYQVKPAKNVRPVPKYSRRAKLAELVAAGGNRHFDRNIANRLWALMLGRGLVHPVDHHHASNPPTHPELLDLLSTEFARMNYNLRAFLREIALSQAYQRGFQLPEQPTEAVETAQQSISEYESRAASADSEAAAADKQAEALLAQLDAALAEANPHRDAEQKALAAIPAVAKKRDDTAKALAAKQQPFSARQPVADALRLALEQAQAAAKILADDKELAAVVASLDKKSQALNSEVAKLKSEAEALTKPAAEAQAEFDAAAKAVDQERMKLAAVEDKIREHRGQLVAVRETIRQLRSASSHASERVAFVKRLLEVNQAGQQLAQLEPTAREAQAAHTAAQTELAVAEKNMTEAAVQMEQATQSLSEAEKTIAEANSLLSARQLFGEALAQAQAAQQQLPDDPELKQLVVSFAGVDDRLDKSALEVEPIVAAQKETLAQVRSALDAATARHQQAAGILENARKLATERSQQFATASAELASVHATYNEAATAVTEGAAHRFHAAVLEPLTPEQLTWSILEATGQFDRQRQTEKARLDKEKPLKPEEQQDPARVAQREQEINEAAFAKLNPVVAKFVGLFGNEQGQPQDAFFATVDQALFFGNAGELRAWLSPSGDNLTARLLKLEDPAALAEELYLSVFTRKPSEEESSAVADYLAHRKDDRTAAVQELAWALLTSAEFRFHH